MAPGVNGHPNVTMEQKKGTRGTWLSSELDATTFFLSITWICFPRTATRICFLRYISRICFST